MKQRSRILGATATLMVAALALGACAGGGDSANKADADGNVTMTLWHNSTTGDGKAFWEGAAAAYHEQNPKVTIKIQAIQNEEMDGKLQNAFNADDAPDIFFARGGAKLKDVVDAGQAMDLTDLITDETKKAINEGAFDALSVDGKVYGMPMSVLPGGIFYSADLFQQAGITEAPKTMEDLNAAIDKLKAAGIQPIALGAKDAWPAAHWYYFFALRECSEDVLAKSALEGDFTNECWLKAGKDLEEFAAAEPFNDGFLTTSAQQGAGSSAGLVANHKAAMELMGGWNVGVIGDLTPDKQPLADLRWFPFPAVDGGKGDPTAMMGGVDGFGCSKNAPKECADFLNFVVNADNQRKYADAFETIPANKDAQDVITSDALKDILPAYEAASSVSTWLDTLLGQNVGNALNVAVVDMLAGKSDAEGILKAVQSAADKG
ncbi:extracellular solute-binding protein [Schaalia sp. ZJ405]|uniref:ABC transporter substrate-binding protein n=1 Tax=unclassified Schaalia TaxID=2691889 RepID=UPI0013EAA91F|nr:MULTISPECIES: extracellular solute-binding protein [unclassified Schaalia]QPK81299.1 extracellular solute-binding protein [Schaalia sp. ZJ405]